MPDWLYTTSENGWTAIAIALNWLQTIFLFKTKPEKDEYRMLVIDGHKSYIEIEFL